MTTIEKIAIRAALKRGLMYTAPSAVSGAALGGLVGAGAKKRKEESRASRILRAALTGAATGAGAGAGGIVAIRAALRAMGKKTVHIRQLMRGRRGKPEAQIRRLIKATSPEEEGVRIFGQAAGAGLAGQVAGGLGAYKATRRKD